MRINGDTITVLMPDGRVWLNRYTLYAPNLFSEFTGNYEVIGNRFFGSGRFLDGTNWMDVADGWPDIVGIQRDGSLWISAQPERRMVHWGVGERLTPASTKLVRFGNDNNWENVVHYGSSALMLKTDGPLWRWGNQPI